MKRMLFLVLSLIPFFLTAQTVDSVAVRQVDSLVRVTRALTRQLESGQTAELRAAATQLALDLNQRADEYTTIGYYQAAERLYLEARNLIGLSSGPTSEHYALVTGNLSGFYSLLGNYPKSLELALQSRDLSRQLGEKGQTTYAASLNHLAKSYLSFNDYAQAEPLLNEALLIYEKAFGKENKEYLENQHNLAELYVETKQHPKALPLLLQLLPAKEKLYGRENIRYINSAQLLAVEYMELGEFDKAEPLLLSVIATNNNLPGTESRNNLEELNTLATLYSHTGQYKKAEELHLEIANKLKRLMDTALSHLSEKETAQYLRKFSYFQDCALSLATTAYPNKQIYPDLYKTCYNNTLYFKGFLLNTANCIRHTIDENPTDREQLNRLKSIERRLGDAYSAPLSERDNALITSLEAQANDLQREFAVISIGYTDPTRNVNWYNVQMFLEPGEVALEFVSFEYFTQSGRWSTDSVIYAALLLQPGEAQPRFIPLFEQRQLAALLHTEGKIPPDFYNDLYASDKKGSQLYNLIWQPIAQVLPQGSTVYCSPSGLLHRLNLGAIPTPDGSTLAQKHRLTVMNSTRQIFLTASPLGTQSNRTAQLYGTILYDATPAVTVSAGDHPGNFPTQRSLDFSQADSTLRGETWGYLKWTEKEITAAAETMKNHGFVVELKKGAEATEESFKVLGQNGPSPRILHVSTHGFFFPDPRPGRTAAPLIGAPSPPEASTFKVSENPMIRSGLILAGGNHAWKTGKPLRPDLEDGILTAYEISQINLSRTELVVLSACETGLGDLVGNEGVYGLQRAFKTAGAHYLIMSLWQVPDLQTQVFMTTFYQHWLNDQMSIPAAFRATQSDMKARYGGAYHWAGFVLVE
jgi:CHAT domain-containing protein